MVSECASGLTMFAECKNVNRIHRRVLHVGTVVMHACVVCLLGTIVCVYLLLKMGTKSITWLSASLTPSRAFRQLSVHRFVL